VTAVLDCGSLSAVLRALLAVESVAANCALCVFAGKAFAPSSGAGLFGAVLYCDCADNIPGIMISAKLSNIEKIVRFPPFRSRKIFRVIHRTPLVRYSHKFRFANLCLPVLVLARRGNSNTQLLKALDYSRSKRGLKEV
jgi:hypothetical protein